MSRRRLMLAACIALGVVGAIWLSRDREVANDSPSERAALPAPAAQRASTEAGDSTSAAPVVAYSRATVTPGLLLGFQAPSSPKTGEAFDVHVVFDGRQAIERIAFEIDYDPTLLRVRTLEEVDYSQRASGERTFFIADRLSDGRVVAVMTMGGDVWGPAYRVRAAVAQFEALAPGSTQIRISNIQVNDRTGRSIEWTASGEQMAIVLH
jgi:hypothetical protein